MRARNNFIAMLSITSIAVLLLPVIPTGGTAVSAVPERRNLASLAPLASAASVILSSGAPAPERRTSTDPLSQSDGPESTNPDSLARPSSDETATLTAGQESSTPQITNSQFEQRAPAKPLADEIKAWAASVSKPEWLGYSVPAVNGDRNVCCNGSWNDGGCGTCFLEDRRGSNSVSVQSKINLEGPRNLVVLYRAESGSVGKIRVASENCALDAGGLKFVWLTGVKSAESVAFLSAFVAGSNLDEHGWEKPSQGALTAIALHAGPEADRAMESFVAPQQRESLRKQAAFWLGAARGASGFALLEQMAKSDPSAEVRAQVAFALSVSHEPGAIEEMIRMAHNDESAHVRGQALFWLAQKAGQKAAATITGAIANDPDTEVKKKAVFALSQMPKDEGVPKLIEVAESNRNPEVRKQAMFWLGQSHDPRALAFFEKVLAH